MIPTYNKFRIGAVETGARGKPGKSVYEIWLESGNKGTTEDFLKAMRGVEGKQGRPGIKGENAYEIWKKQPGNEGKTEQDFLNSMKGDKGDKGDKGGMYVPSISSDGVLSWSNDSNLENPQPFNISDLILNEVKESRIDTTGKTFSKLKERLDSDFKKLSEFIKNNDTKDEVVQARTATTGENFMSLDDRIDHEVMRLREKIEVTMLEQEDKERHDISNTIEGMSSDMVIKGKTIKLDNSEIKSFGQEENKISILSSGKNIFNIKNFKISQGSVYGYMELDKTISKYTLSIKEKDADVDITDIYFGFSETGIDATLGTNWIIENGKKIKDSLTATSKFLSVYPNSKESLEKIFKKYNIQLEAGTQTSPYQPYECDKKDILLSELGFDEGLRGLNTTVYDELNDIENVVIKRIEKYVFTGNEDISINDERTETISFRYLNNSHETSWIDTDNLLCSSLPSIGQKIYESDFEGTASDKIGFIFRINKTKLITPDISGFKTWLKNNPTTVYYKLAEPIETPLNENINVKTFNDKTYVNFENSINGTSSFKVPVNTNKLINDLKFEKEDLKEKFNNLTTEFEKFKTLMIQTLPYKEEE
ncbi:virion structural protein [Clostridium phage CPS2]|uniref:Virion structure protein n=1 Tax=Clostridium phage CPS2 TaxID=2175605 RepID=A0A343X846_9CAUD|nr:virion structural protein [Clostridium phage CPS2]AWG96522.1 virion structure protein [Clostridium phage CPS2]